MPIRFRQDTSYYVSKICNISTRQKYMVYFWYYDLAYSKPDIHDCLNNKLTTYIIYRERKIMSKYFFQKTACVFLSNKPGQRAFQINVVLMGLWHCNSLTQWIQLYDISNNHLLYSYYFSSFNVLYVYQANIKQIVESIRIIANSKDFATNLINSFDCTKDKTLFSLSCVHI